MEVLFLLNDSLCACIVLVCFKKILSIVWILYPGDQALKEIQEQKEEQQVLHEDERSKSTKIIEEKGIQTKNTLKLKLWIVVE